MSSLRHAAALLSRTNTFPGLATLVAPLGFESPLPLDVESRRALGLGAPIRHASVAQGHGTLRALVAELRADAVVHEDVSRAAARLASRSPELLWLLVAVQPSTHVVVIAAPAPGTHTKVCALMVDTRRVVDSDAETWAAMEAAAAGSDLLVHHRWRELLGRDALTRRFYRELEGVVADLAAAATGDARESARREIALLYASRLLFLAFLEAKGWLNEDRDFLRRAFDDRCAGGGNVHRRLLEPLFFGTLNTPVSRRAAAATALGRIPFLNGGLFSRTSLEKRHRTLHFPDDALGALIGGLLARFRVTAREDSTTWSEAAVDPEMLGRAFESLMASEDRRVSGSFYTPSTCIVRVAGEGLDEVLAARGAPRDLLRAARDDEALPPRERARLRSALVGLRVLDPACGSGAFLVHMLERIADLVRASGDERPVGERRRDVLTHSIFGVDVNPTAVWLCELRLWLSVVIESTECDPLRVAPLPNLDRHIRAGDALAGPAFDDIPRIAAPMALGRLRGRYARSTGCRKRSLARALDREERRAAVAVARRECDSLAARRRDLLCALRTRDLFAGHITPAAADRRELDALRRASRDVRRRIAALLSGASLPFSFPVHFADAAAGGGFDLVIGNPPWVRLHHIPHSMKAGLRARYRSFREAAWMPGAADTGAGRGFAAQADLSSLFVERSLALVRPNGAVALLLPAKLWRSLAGGGVRSVLANGAELQAVEDWTESAVAFDAVVYPSFLLATRRAAASPASTVVAHADAATLPSGKVRVAVHRRHDALEWTLPRSAIALDGTPGAPWILVPPDVRHGFDRLAAAGTPLAHSPLGRPLLGVKSGCNEAFIVTPRPGWNEAGDQPWPVRDGPREQCVEATLLRPLLRGEAVRPWRARPDDSVLLWTHDSLDAPLVHLPSGAAAWLVPFRRKLEARSDARRRGRWWSLFRTEAARSDRPRVVWSDIGRTPRALVLHAGDPTVPLNSCYVVRTPSHDDALALCALLNSSVAAAWLATIAEPARGGYHRYLGWTLARLPLPREWSRAVRILAPLARAAIGGSPPDAATLADAAIRAYRVRAHDLGPLLTWCLR
ncbi:MAG TPA: N-6 DNA methylase [Gemmatimonadaceae bacterium]|nr:N-6 DNA methylase [Gemmatimonadaceae bacterium]